MKGLEKNYDNYLSPTRDGFIKGKRDLVGTIILNGESKSISRIDGMDLHLNIPLEFQYAVERVVDKGKKITGAQEVLVAVMDSNSGKILAMATSNRFNPEKLQRVT